jgi:cell wall-associated NlpC family hydrolase
VKLLQFQTQYRCQATLNLFDSPRLDRLATQAAAGRFLQVVARVETVQALEVWLVEDDYSGWLPEFEVAQLQLAEHPFQPIAVSLAEIQSRLPDAIAYAQAAMAQSNYYLWGGTVPPNYDCSGLVQAAFASVGIWLPRDAYQQEAFVTPIALADLQPGNLIFFGTPTKATHVGIYLGDDRYIHSSGKEQGRNGIGIDRVSGVGDPVSQTYHAQLRGAGRVDRAYQPRRTV